MLQTYQINMQQFMRPHIPHWTPYDPAGLDCIAINENGYGKSDDEGCEILMINKAA